MCQGSWDVGHLCLLLFSSLFSLACGDGSVHGTVLLVFNYVSVPEAFNDLVSDVILSTVI